MFWQKFIPKELKTYIFHLTIVLITFLTSLSFAQQVEEFPKFSKNDKILILAPHPDDEAIGTAGVIQKALKAGSQIKVVCLTNGDYNELSFIVYEKRLTFRKREFLHMGEVRGKETIEAMKYLGLDDNNIVFLGYPDGGTMQILLKYWGNIRPFKSFFTRVSKVPYPQTESFNAPYLGESVLKDLKTIILDFKPTKVFVSHAYDTNKDHQALYLFLQVALWDLADKIKKPDVFAYLVHFPRWPLPRGYYPDLDMSPPKGFNGILWYKLPLTEEEIKLKHDAISFYKSQIGYDPPYLFTFARKNELFGDFRIVDLEEQKTEELYWQDLKFSGNGEDNLESNNRNQERLISALAYAYDENNFFVKLALKQKINKNFGINIYLVGYNKETDFVNMPKINLNIGINGLCIRDKKKILIAKDARLSIEGKVLIIKLPISILGNPDYILTSARMRSNDLSSDETAWRILRLE